MDTLRPQIFVLLFLIPILSRSQNTIEPYIGYGIDPGNKALFSQVNAGLQYPVINRRVYQMLIRVQGGLPLSGTSGNDAAYTSDPSLPLHVTAAYKAKWYSAAFIIGNRFRLVSWAGKNTISPFVSAGVIYQRIAVGHYDYNMEKYTVLNPHRSLKKSGPCIGGGIQYKRDLGRGAAFLQTEFLSSPLVESRNNYNYKLPVPFAMNIGYVVEFNKKNK
ncbi:MAG TPA: hypothetical protein PLL71_10395 [Agriterribacter sp.]|nr:hypothetical protein [Agriterribacter sp.]HRQ49682.1 hypothetical protein [Agriterribacter sp.]